MRQQDEEAAAPSGAVQAEEDGNRERSQKLYDSYDRNLQGLRKIAFVTDLRDVCSWFLGFCALTWASAVLLGAYISNLTIWHYYDVSLLLFFEGLRFGIAALLRFLGYRIWHPCRWSLRSLASFILPLGMGGFAVLSILPPPVNLKIRCAFPHPFLHHHTCTNAFNLPPPPPPDDSPAGYIHNHLYPSLRIFYSLVLANGLIILLGSSIAGIMRRCYVHSSDISLRDYHDRMLDTTNSWLHPTVDLNFAFNIQGSQYSKRQKAITVFKEYEHLINYLYMHEKGVEAVEVALAAEDRYVREAAAHIVGFWAQEEAKDKLKDRLPLCFQRGMLSKLADIAAESYGSLGAAAAHSFEVLLESVNLEWIGMVACVRSKSTGQDLIDILLSRAAELLHPPCPRPDTLPSSLQKESHAHISALRQYLLRLRGEESQPSSDDKVMTDFIKGEKAKLAQKMQKAVRKGNAKWSGTNEAMMLQSLKDELSQSLKDELSKFPTTEHGSSPLTATSRRLVEATFILLFNAAVPLVCLGVGFIVNALIS